MSCTGRRSLHHRNRCFLHHRNGRFGRPVLGALVAVAVLAAGCGTGTSTGEGDAPAAGADGSPSGTVRLYTSHSQDVVDALLAAYDAEYPDVSVELFRAPTGQLSARIAAEQRSGGIRGDVLLLSDPLSMQQYAAQDVLRQWSPPEESVVPAGSKTDTFWGVATLDMVVVHAPGAAPASWQDLADPRYRDAVAIPNPSFAGSAFGALGYFALAEDFGFDYYQRLKDNGAVQVQSPGEVITGVAEGRFQAGMTLGFSAQEAIDKGSPIEMTAPEPGAIRMYAPVAVFADAANVTAAESFANFLLTTPAQEVIADLGRAPIRADLASASPDHPTVSPDWPTVFERQAELRASYRDIFGG
jgi:iron(III) transport system substrate-binding protein